MKTRSKAIERIINEGNGIAYRTNVSAKEYSSFRIGGSIAILAEPKNEAELQCLINAAKQVDCPYYVFGNGSNLLIQDDPMDALFIRLGETYSGYTIDGNVIEAAAGTLLGTVARASVKAGLRGLEWAAGIPGSVGGGIAMNAGAYGGEMKQVLKSVRLLKNGVILEHSVAEEDMGYRRSAFGFPNAIVLSGRFELEIDDGSAMKLMKEYSQRRRDKQPLELPSAGSTFKRPEGHFAAKLIEDAGLKGLRIGNAMVSEKHAGFIVNVGDASFSDVITLIEKVRKRVFDEFNVKLEPEVKIITDKYLTEHQ